MSVDVVPVMLNQWFVDYGIQALSFPFWLLAYWLSGTISHTKGCELGTTKR